MSHLEDLEEYDAELELALKREYATVFGMFRYCVLTQEATYLCNKLDLKIEHQPSYPLFHLTMEDVWVWDKNRPSRIIPRADVHTTSDVTVEELKPDDLIPTTLPPDFSAPPEADPGRPMLLAVDVGNTQTVLGLYAAAELAEHWRLTTDARRTTDELDVELAGLLAARRGLADVVSASALSTTVPDADAPWTSVLASASRAPSPIDRPRRPHGRAGADGQPAGGRPRPDRQLGRRARPLRRAVHRGRLRHLDELRRRSRPTASSSAGRSRRASRSRWTRSTAGRRAW